MSDKDKEKKVKKPRCGTTPTISLPQGRTAGRRGRHRWRLCHHRLRIRGNAVIAVITIGGITCGQTPTELARRALAFLFFAKL